MRGRKNKSKSASNANNNVTFNPVITVNGLQASAEEANPMLFDMLESYRRENEAMVHQLRLKGELMAYKDKEIKRLEADNARLKAMLACSFAN